MVNFKYIGIIVFGEKILYIFLVIFLILLMLKDKKKINNGLWNFFRVFMECYLDVGRKADVFSVVGVVVIFIK